jgi:hypothetical protein
MAATRREFLSMSLIAGAGLALPGKAFAQSVSPEAAEAGAGASTALDSASTVFTRGIGMYPGAPSENFQPELLLDADAPYRNLALLRPAYASSSYDYNLTAQLVTDGLVDTVLPQWITTVVDGQILPKTEREIVVDHFQSAVLELPSSNPAVELHLGGGAVPSTVDRLELFVVVPGHVVPDSLTFTVSVSDDAHTWRQTGSVTGGHPLPTENYPPDLVRGSQLLNPSVVQATDRGCGQQCQRRHHRSSDGRNRDGNLLAARTDRLLSWAAAHQSGRPVQLYECLEKCHSRRGMGVGRSWVRIRVR